MAGASLMWRLARAQAHDRDGCGAGPQRHRAQFARFLALVEAHFQSHWTLGQYARAWACPPSGSTGWRGRNRPPRFEVVHERLTREACRRLLHTAVPATRLALHLGFEVTQPCSLRVFSGGAWATARSAGGRCKAASAYPHPSPHKHLGLRGVWGHPQWYGSE